MTKLHWQIERAFECYSPGKGKLGHPLPAFSAANKSQQISDYIQTIEKFRSHHWDHLYAILDTASQNKVEISVEDQAMDNLLVKSRANVFEPSSSPPPGDGLSSDEDLED